MSSRSTLPRPARTTPTRGFLLVGLAALSWGTSGIVGHVVADRTGLDPLDIASHRMAIASAALLAVRLARRHDGRHDRARPPLTGGLRWRLVPGGAGLAVYQCAYFAAVATAGGSIATLVPLRL